MVQGLDNAKAIMFDLDGTLVCSENLHRGAWVAIFNQLKITSLPFKEEELVGFNDLSFAKLLVEKLKLDHCPYELARSKQQIYLSQSLDELGHPAGRDEFLDYVSKRFQLAVVTSCTREEAKMILDHQGLSPYFEFVVTACDVEKPKPHPEPYQQAVNRLGINPGEGMVIEDSFHGIDASEKAGTCSIAIGTRFAQFPNTPHVPVYKDYTEMLVAFRKILG
ncbi:MAG: Fructose-1-phosphate phosphatase YqaB [Chlamydiia bacterium]|nr:Fructose-1-phosphate phosphatase YqaB [Chlamydiia bacterium]